MAKLMKLAVLFVLFVAAVVVAVNWRSVFGHAETVDSRIETMDSLLIMKSGGFTGSRSGLCSGHVSGAVLPQSADTAASAGREEFNDSIKR